MVLDKEKRFKHKKRPAWSHSDKESVDPAFRHKKGVVGRTHMQDSSVASCLSPPLTWRLQSPPPTSSTYPSLYFPSMMRGLG